MEQEGFGKKGKEFDPTPPKKFRIQCEVCGEKKADSRLPRWAAWSPAKIWFLVQICCACALRANVADHAWHCPVFHVGEEEKKSCALCDRFLARPFFTSQGNRDVCSMCSTNLQLGKSASYTRGQYQRECTPFNFRNWPMALRNQGTLYVDPVPAKPVPNFPGYPSSGPDSDEESEFSSGEDWEYERRCIVCNNLYFYPSFRQGRHECCDCLNARGDEVHKRHCHSCHDATKFCGHCGEYKDDVVFQPSNSRFWCDSCWNRPPSPDPMDD